MGPKLKPCDAHGSPSHVQRRNWGPFGGSFVPSSAQWRHNMIMGNVASKKWKIPGSSWEPSCAKLEPGWVQVGPKLRPCQRQIGPMLWPCGIATVRLGLVALTWKMYENVQSTSTTVPCTFWRPENAPPSCSCTMLTDRSIRCIRC